MYWGGTIKGSVYGMSGDAPFSQAVQNRFEADAGKKITIVNTGQAWATFEPTAMQNAIASGAIPLVTMALEGQTLAEIAAGKQDAQIRAWARAAKAFGYPFLFRPWWEMNGNWYSWGRSPDYVAAWRHFHDVVEEVGATNVTWAWVVNTVWNEPASDPTPYYPGSAYVDWVGIDAYNFGTNPLQPDRWTTPAETIRPTLEVVNRIAPGKPVCICEIASTEIGGSKAAWINELLTYLPSQPSIQALLWFNWNIEQNGGKFDWPIESSASSQQAFHEGIQNAAYLSSLPALTPLAKVPSPNQPVAASTAGAPPGSSAAAQKAKGPRIRFLSVHLDQRTGTATLKLQVPRPGRVKLSGKGIRARMRWHDRGRWSDAAPLPIVRRLRRPRDIELKIASTGPSLKTLLRRGKVDVVLKADLTPSSGNVIHGRKPLSLRRGR